MNEDTGEHGWAMEKLIPKQVSDYIGTVGGFKVKSCKEILSLPSLERCTDAKI